jgi:hypothetical protein
MDQVITITSTVPKERRLSRKEQKVLSKQKKKRKPSIGSGICIDTADTTTDCNNNHGGATATSTTTATNITAVKEIHQVPSTSTTAQHDKKHEEYLTKYTPILVPIDDIPIDDMNHCQSKVSSLGKWFPKAVQSKRTSTQQLLVPVSRTTDGTCTPNNTVDTDSPDKKAAILLFYQYISPLWTPPFQLTFNFFGTNVSVYGTTRPGTHM